MSLCLYVSVFLCVSVSLSFFSDVYTQVESINRKEVLIDDFILHAHDFILHAHFIVALEYDMQVEYINSKAVFIDAHTVELTNKRGEKSTKTAEKFIIATGEFLKNQRHIGFTEIIYWTLKFPDFHQAAGQSI